MGIQLGGQKSTWECLAEILKAHGNCQSTSAGDVAFDRQIFNFSAGSTRIHRMRVQLGGQKSTWECLAEILKAHANCQASSTASRNLDLNLARFRASDGRIINKSA